MGMTGTDNVNSITESYIIARYKQVFTQMC